jgi:dCMP deaminase
VNKKHLDIRKQQLKLLASASPCVRRKVSALIVAPGSNVVISEGYNGTPRQSISVLCGGSKCLRENITSGLNNDVGCHHAEMNAILNAGRIGTSCINTWMLTSCDPCLMCSKAIHHAGITKVYAPLNYAEHRAGLEYLQDNLVVLEKL